MQSLPKIAIVTFVIHAAIALVPTAGMALDPSSTDANAIMRAALASSNAERSRSRMKMTIRQGDNTRERVMSVRALRTLEARKTLILIERPSDVRNTGFLSVDSAERRKGEQWLYLPELHRVARVPSSGKSDPFVGSDFSIADLTPRNPDDYHYKLLNAAARVDGEECWLVEATPVNAQIVQDTGYLKTQYWIGKTRQVPLQMKLSSVDEKTVKYLKASDIRQVASVWTPHRLQMRTMEGSVLLSETVLEVLGDDNDAKDVQDADFTQQRLEGGV